MMRGVTVDGRKLPPYVILKIKLPKEQFSVSWDCFQNTGKEWMTEELMADWH